MSVRFFSSEYLAALADEAASSPRLRQHRNEHRSYEEPCQRLFNAIGVESYIRPHRHAQASTVETLVAVRGLFGLIAFDDQGSVRETIRFGTEKYGDTSESGVGVEIDANTWHTVVALRANSVLLEVKAGPFDPNAAKEFASWAPAEGTAAARDYLHWLRTLIPDTSTVAPIR